MKNFQDTCNRRRVTYGKQFSTSELAPQFIPYFESGQRIIVKTHYGETLRGYVGITTGWRPCFLLMNNTRSVGSSNCLAASDEIVGTVNKFNR
jgi:hypothetical protein